MNPTRPLSSTRLALVGVWFGILVWGARPLSAGEPGEAAGPTYDISKSFSLAANPNGVWSYGWKSSLTGPFTLLTGTDTVIHENGVPVQVWERSSWVVPPLVVYNATTNVSIHDSGQGVYPPGTLYFIAGLDGTPQNFGAIRFTVPVGGAGLYLLESAVRCYLDGDRSGDTDYHVVVNSTEAFGAFIAPRSASGYTNHFNLAVGDTVDFMVGRGADNMLYGSGLKIQGALRRLAPVVHRATATAQVVNGFVVGITMTDPGYGYPDTPPPTVLIHDATGIGVAVHAIVNGGVVERIEIDNPGRGYSSNATVVIAPPPFSPSLSIRVKTVSVEMSVVLGRKYQLDVSSDLKTWAHAGDPFVAEADVIVQEFDVTETGRYFRIGEVP